MAISTWATLQLNGNSNRRLSGLHASDLWTALQLSPAGYTYAVTAEGALTTPVIVALIML